MRGGAGRGGGVWRRVVSLWRDQFRAPWETPRLTAVEDAVVCGLAHEVEARIACHNVAACKAVIDLQGERTWAWAQARRGFSEWVGLRGRDLCHRPALRPALERPAPPACAGATCTSGLRPRHPGWHGAPATWEGQSHTNKQAAHTHIDPRARAVEENVLGYGRIRGHALVVEAGLL